ncbi:MAG: transcription-repair coupling factor [Clostridia bacterium]|nr:transcription-repair coupling factor [Clostridia bacterium]
MNEGLFTAYQDLPEWKKLLERLNAGDCTALSEIAEGERPFAAAALAHKTGRPIVLVAPTELVSQRQAQDVERLTGGGSAVLPARDVQFSRAAMSRESTWQRLQVLDQLVQGKVRVLCTSVDALLDRCTPAKRFRQAVITVAEGERHAPDQLIKRLMENGYERVSMVEGQGQCAMRGSILDVFPANAPDAVRIEFFDDEVDSLRRFDCISQRSIARIKSVRLSPATECLFGDPEAAAQRLKAALDAGVGQAMEEAQDDERGVPSQEETDGLPSLDDFLSELDALELTEDILKEGGKQEAKAERKPMTEDELNWKRHLDDVERIRAGQSIRTAPMWMNVLCEQTVTVTDYLDDPIILLDRPDQYAARIRAALDGFADSYEDARLRGDAFDAQKELLFTYDDLLADWQKHPSITLSDIISTSGRLKPTQAIAFASKPAMPYQSRLEPLKQDIDKWKAEGFAIILLTGGEARGRRLQKALEEQGAPCVYTETLDGNLVEREVMLLPVAYGKGFIHPGAKLVVLSDTDIYGTAYQRAKKKQNAGERIASFTDLKVGDYVVHDLHGVGLYKGVVQLDSDGVKRDYLLIHYAGTDKLYVPADQFDRVTKFIGAEHSLPKLNRLGGQEWERQKSKVKAGLKKLAFDLAELYAKRSKNTGYAFSHENPWQQEFEDMFPYELTEDQQKSVAQIEADMESSRNMDRLLCGDVGYGKTEVALRAAFKAVVEGKQVAILAPTTILVQQHYNTIKKRFKGFPVKFDMLSRFRTAKEQKEIARQLKEGELDLVVGTHRLINKDVQFKDLGLLIVDEEQRFGVSHKEHIQHMKTRVDVLTLSATPIPRTLHMSMVGIRDMSILETPPEERLPVKTYVMEYSDAVIREAIRREMARGGQVYFLYNRVRSIEQMHERIKTLVPDARIGIAHGQMKENALEDVMLDFYAGAYDVLLCTTIVESGLDVPDANTLIVFDADRFGLSQLYQIRGRVGRSNRQAYAYFTIRGGKMLSETAEQRLSAIREFTEFGAGYRIAMRDLEIRGAGDVLGPQQSGHLSTVGYDMYVKLIEQAVGEVQGIEQTPELDTRVELRLDAFLPEAYVPQEKLRVEIYKRIAMIQDEAGRLDIEEELIDRFGDVPQPVENLMHIAQLRGITRRMGVSLLTLRPDGVHMRLDEKFLPDPALLFEAVTRTDKRLKFNVGKTPELVLAQPRMDAESAMHTTIYVMTKVYEELKELKEQQKKAAEGEN